ncbi:MAG: tyrosine-type recombinase/integrase [Planctomycetota bacterium]
MGIVSEATLRWYKPRLASLLNHLGDGEIDAITTADLRRWRTSLVRKETRWEDHPRRQTVDGGLSPQTLRSYVRAARAFFSWLEAEGLMDHNPARRLKLPPLPDEPPKEISQRDALRILRAAQDNPRDYAILRFLCDTGCRVGGLVGLQVEDLSASPAAEGVHRAVVREKGRGGERKSRTVYFSAATAQALQDYLEVRPDVDTRTLFLTEQPGRPPRPLRTEGVYRMIERYAKRLEIKGRWNPHAWRHAWAKGALRRGADLGTVAQILGHSSIQVTADFYGRWSDDELADRHARFSWLNESEDK